MTKLKEVKKCKKCGGIAVLIKPSAKWKKFGLGEYYYHYTHKSCCGRYSKNDKNLTVWTKDDEINHLIKLVREYRERCEQMEEIMKKLMIPTLK